MAVKYPMTTMLKKRVAKRIYATDKGKTLTLKQLNGFSLAKLEYIEERIGSFRLVLKGKS